MRYHSVRFLTLARAAARELRVTGAPFVQSAHARVAHGACIPLGRSIAGFCLLRGGAHLAKTLPTGR